MKKEEAEPRHEAADQGAQQSPGQHIRRIVHAHIYLADGNAAGPEEEEGRKKAPLFAPEKTDEKNGNGKMIARMGRGETLARPAGDAQCDLLLKLRMLTGPQPRHSRLDEAAARKIGKAHREQEHHYGHPGPAAETAEKKKEKEGVKRNPGELVAPPWHDGIQKPVSQRTVDPEEDFPVYFQQPVHSSLFFRAITISRSDSSSRKGPRR